MVYTGFDLIASDNEWIRIHPQYIDLNSINQFSNMFDGKRKFYNMY